MSDLDSFFAKKDKKKPKGKKFTTTDEIARRLEETEKKLDKVILPKPEVVKKVDENTEDQEVPEEPQDKEEEEWNDFTDEAQKDLTDLKITKLLIDDEDEGSSCLTDEDREKREHLEKRDGVWNTDMSYQPPPPPVLVENTIEDDKAAVLEAAAAAAGNTGSSYVPPHMRNMVPSHLPKGGAGGGSSRRNKTAPDISNEMAFPSLSDSQGTSPMGGAWGKKKNNLEGFENVKHGSTRSAHDDYGAPKLSTANRFDALSENS